MTERKIPGLHDWQVAQAENAGNKNVETTMIYTHVLRDMSHDPQSPLDKLLASPAGPREKTS